MYKKYIKRGIDFFASLFAICLLWPLFLLIAILIKLDSKGPVFFKQKRLGRHGKEFEILKFRSMCIGAETMGSKQYSFEGDPRITRVGNILRKTSLDEIPQFINILKGDMSLIGFRPPLTYHPYKYEDYTEEQKRMFDLRPGVTGWAQVNGRKQIDWNKRIELNIWYSNNISFILDCKIVILTIYKILKNENNTNIGKTIK
ncbi:sugar transferase [Fusobacterium sp.]|uniref:sugar transferase n=1 Tax=Fusobacterium sp. TaxID=68766 RepID=UPI0025C2F7A3|nr:sugar transferase [Fusobacterium sp.]MCI7224439.1 sugar transferase [Fusobacterium sp.]